MRWVTGRPLPHGVWTKVLPHEGVKTWRWSEPSRYRNWTMEHKCDLVQWRKVKAARDQRQIIQDNIEHLAQVYRNWEW